MDPISEVLLAYGRAWNESNVAAREALLERCWEEDGTYTDPRTHVEGRAALGDLIGNLVDRQRVVFASGWDEHHGLIRFAWQAYRPDGTLLVDGVDFGELAPTGRLGRIVGFYGGLPPAPKHWPSNLLAPSEADEPPERGR